MFTMWPPCSTICEGDTRAAGRDFLLADVFGSTHADHRVARPSLRNLMPKHLVRSGCTGPDYDIGTDANELEAASSIKVDAGIADTAGHHYTVDGPFLQETMCTVPSHS